MVKQKVLLFYINAIHDGGAERVIIQLAHHFAQEGYRAVLVTSFVDENEYPVPGNVERVTLEEKEIKSRVKRNITRIAKLRHIVKEYKPSGVITFMPEPCFRMQIATIGLRVTKIMSVRNDPKVQYCGLSGFILGKILLPLAEGCVFQTDEAKEWFPRRFQRKSAVIFNDVDHVFFETPYSGGNDLVNMGRLSEQKNQKLLIEAFSKIAAKYPENNLLIYGIGELKDELDTLIKEKGLEGRVILKGLTNDAQGVLSKAKAFVLSSDYEGMPNALMEALAVGVPSISTDCPCGGPRALIKSGENGLLVPVNDSEELALAMNSILANEAYSIELGEKARESAKKYETMTIFSQWKTYVESVISSAR